MTEQAGGARSFTEAAARAGLGAPRAVHLGAQPEAANPGCLIAGVVVFGAAAVVLFAVGASVWGLIAAILALPGLTGRWLDGSTSKRNQGVRLELYEHGLVAALGGRVHTVRYASTELTTRTVHHTGIASYVVFEYTLTDLDGQKFVLRGRSDDSGADVAERGRIGAPRVWGPAIQRGIADAHLPGAAAPLSAGGRLRFGGLWLTAREAGSAKTTAKWPEIEKITLRDGVVELASRPPIRAAVSAIPNFVVFQTLAEHLRQQAKG
ncbi:DUF6585 family protein [Amycolatopsis magusensis]|uniref:DUF6585 family protein n=1 Tax=Amycolatopsis magusensis TaxID=882444 RepID=UPI0037B766CF